MSNSIAGHLCQRCATRNRLGNARVKEQDCELCKGLFLSVPVLAQQLVEKMKHVGGENSTFAVGTKVPKPIETTEELIWEQTDLSNAEALKAELNREIGKYVERHSNFTFDPKEPHIRATIDPSGQHIHLAVRPVFIFGKYKKKLQMRQTKKEGSPEQSVEALIEKHMITATKGMKVTLHGAGREDIDAFMLGSGRPFVAEIHKPAIRRVNWKDVEKKINKSNEGIEVVGLRPTDRQTIEVIKGARFDKTYEVVMEIDRPIIQKELKKIKPVRLFQRTPIRVSNRRADLVRKRRIKEIRSELIDGNHIKLEMTTEAGTYVKEFISGDEGRTNPSVSSIIGRKAKCVKLTVTKIHSEWLEDFW